MSPTADDRDDSAAQAMSDAAATLQPPGDPGDAGTQNTDITDGSGGQTSGAPAEKSQAELNAEHAAAIQKKLDEQAGADTTAVEPEKPDPATAGGVSSGAGTTGTLADGAAAEQEQQADDQPVTSEGVPEHLQGSPIGEEIMQRLRYFENLVEHLFSHVETLGGALSRTGTAVPALPHFPSLKNRLGNYNPHT